jgi:hypothetical protein
MAKAEIKTRGGMHINIEGDAEEIAAVIANVKGREDLIEARRQFTEKQRSIPKKARDSLVDFILQLKEEGFFKKPRKVIDVKEALDQNAHHYPFPSISTALIRQVKKGELGRVSEGNAWAYVNR